MPKTIAISPSISRISPQDQRLSWQQQLSQAFNQAEELLEYLELDINAQTDFSLDSLGFSLKVPLAYARKMQKGNPDDPLLRQVMSQTREALQAPGYTTDPVGDLQSSQTPGLLHKYRGRVLLIATPACAVHCRYCFRRHFPYQQQHPENSQWQDALRYIREDTSIREVILSGGDPLVLSDSRLQQLIKRLEAIPHLSRLRIHTRLPVVLPDRITPQLIETLQNTRFATSIVIHANHAREIGSDETRVLRGLQAAGISLLNQAVLLNNVNSELSAQIELAEALYSAGVLPYYLHLLDPVQGAAHYETSLEHAQGLIRQMRAHLPGYLVPRLVREIAGENSKTPADEL